MPEKVKSVKRGTFALRARLRFKRGTFALRARLRFKYPASGTLKPGSAPFGETGEIMKIHFGSVVQYNLAGKAAVNLTAGNRMV